MTAPRHAEPTLQFIEEHCEKFRDLFEEVRTFENFQALHLGLLSQLPRKSLPALAKFLGLPNPQRLHHVLVTPHLSTQELAQRRLDILKEALMGRPLTLMIDETGSRKKGSSTDYVARQYLGSLGKVDNGLVTVHVVALVGEVTLPLTWRVFKPKGRLRDSDTHASKIRLAAQMLEEVSGWGLEVELVVADSAYGMASEFMRCVQRHQWKYAVAIRSDFGLYLGPDDEVWRKDWVELERHFSDGSTQQRWAQEVVWGRERTERYIRLTSDPETQPANETSFVRTNLEGAKGLEALPDAYGSRTWVETCFRNTKTELGWHDWRLTRWEHIERWFEVVLSAYTLIGLKALARSEAPHRELKPKALEDKELPEWSGGPRWVDVLNDIRVLVRSFGALVTLSLWMVIFPIEPHQLAASLRILFSLPFL